MRLLIEKTYICLITEGKAPSSDFSVYKAKLLDQIKEAVDDGVSMIQIREKELTAKQLFELTREAKNAILKSKALLLVNERVDIAVAAGADGVHLPSTALTPAFVRQIVPVHFIIGVSTHSTTEVTEARDKGADFAMFGPVFATPGKGEPAGLAVLKEVCESAKGFPVLALGGVDEKNFGAVLNAGARGIAAIRALNDPETRRLILRHTGFKDRNSGEVKRP